MKIAYQRGKPIMVARPKDALRARAIQALAREAVEKEDHARLEELQKETIDYDIVGFFATDDENGDERVIIDKAGKRVDVLRDGDSLVTQGTEPVRDGPPRRERGASHNRPKAKAARQARKAARKAARR